MLRRTPLKAKRDKPRRNEGRVTHKRPADPDKAQQREHLDRIGKMTCLVPKCFQDSVIHHIMHMTGKRRRRDDRFIAPLCPGHHNMEKRSVHLLGGEAAFKEEFTVDLVAWAVAQWEDTKNGT